MKSPLLFFTSLLILILLKSCSESPNGKEEGKYMGSVFYETIESSPNFKLPLNITSDSIAKNKSIRPLLFPDYLGDRHFTNDSTFLSTHLCDIDNFFEYQYIATGVMTGIISAKKISDSIYAVCYYRFQGDLKEFGDKKIFLATYNIKASAKPVDRILLYGYMKGHYKLTSSINKYFNITTNHFLSLDNLQMPYDNYPRNVFDITFVRNSYKINSDGKFIKTSFYKGFGTARWSIEKDFQLYSDTLSTQVGWEYDTRNHHYYKEDSKVILRNNRIEKISNS